MQKFIKIRGAKTHNLKNCNLDLEINKISCLLGPSGSGKSSLAVHTLYAESKRRFINSLPNSSKFFIKLPGEVNVDEINPVLPTWCLHQHNPTLGSRLSVIDTVGLKESLEKIFFSKSQAYCPVHKCALERGNLEQLAQEWIGSFQDQKAYLYFDKKHFEQIGLKASYGILEGRRVMVRDDLDLLEFSRFKISSLDAVLSKLKEIPKSVESLCLLVGDQLIEAKLTSHLQCPICDYQLDREIVNWRDFSSDRSAAACPSCKGYGTKLVYDKNKFVKQPELSIKDGAISILNYGRFSHLKLAIEQEFKRQKISLDKPFHELPEKKWSILFSGSGRFEGFNKVLDELEKYKYKKHIRILLRSLQSEELCQDCGGSRVNKAIQSFCIDLNNNTKKNHKKKSTNNKINLISFKDVLTSNLDELHSILSHIEIGQDKTLLKNIEACRYTLSFALKMNLGYLNLSKKTKTLSSGEYQKLLLIKYLAFQGSGSLFILDEPSTGLDSEECKALLKSLLELKSQGNTILLIEHNPFFHKNADHLIHMGPGAGMLGGEILPKNKIKQPKVSQSKSNKLQKRENLKNALVFEDLELNQQKIKQLKIAEFCLTQVSGGSRSEKEKLFTNYLPELIKTKLNKTPLTKYDDCNFKKFEISESIKDVLIFSLDFQNFSSRSTVGTYTELGKNLRGYYSKLPVSKSMGLSEAHFSPNSELGKCQSCDGKGEIEIEMSYIEDIKIPCDDCQGKKIKPLYADIFDGEMTYFESLNKPLYAIKDKVIRTPKFRKMYQYLELLKLTYLSIGRGLTTLSGGERQRIALLSHLMKNPAGSLLIFQNLSYGLSSYELADLYSFIHSLCDTGVTIIVVDNNELLESYCDYKIHLS